MIPQDSKPRILDIALQAGVSTATVDRVLNGRAGVRPKTVHKVHEAARFLAETGGRPRVLAPRSEGLALRAFLGGRPGFANELLGQALRDTARSRATPLQLEFVCRTNPAALAAQLRACRDDGTGGVIVQPVEHPFVRDAISDLVAQGIQVVTVLSQMPGIDHLGHVGLDNRAAGRLAGQILGYLCAGRGTAAIFHSNAIYRSHEDREAGLRSILREEFPQLEIIETLSTDDDPALCLRQTADLLARRPELTAIVNLAAGNRGIERALLDAGRARTVQFIAFNLTPLSRNALIERSINAVIHQDMARIAAEAIAALCAGQHGHPLPHVTIPCELILRENLRDLRGAPASFDASF